LDLKASKKRQRNLRDDMSLGDDDGEAPRKKPVKQECLCVRVYQWSMFICVRV
jgi:hypothetical protein